MQLKDIKRREIAIVMTDIIGSTRFVQRYGAVKSSLWFAKNDKLIMSLIYQNNGTFIDASDGTLCYFDTISDAISFSFSYKRSLVKYKFPFRARLGIHWDEMIITKTSQSLIEVGAKRMNIEGIGKNICARTMSICSEEQILMSHKAFLVFKSRISSNNFIPKDALVVLVGLYSFKGVKEPEQIYALGTEEKHLQPPQSNEKVKRLGGNKKIKTRLKHKKTKELIEYFFWRLSFLYMIYFVYIFWPLLRYFDTIDNIHFYIIYFYENMRYFIALLIKQKIS
jgi:hypothetical protein